MSFALPEPIGADELRARRSALAAALAATGLDGWVAFGDDRPFAGADHVRWLTGFHPHFEPVIAVGGPDGEVTILTGPETVGLATIETAETAVAGVLAIEELLHPGLRYASIPVHPGPATMRRLLDQRPRVALLGGAQIPAHLVRTLIEPCAAQGMELVAADDTAYALRAVKSPAEQRLLDAAFAIAADGMRAAAQAIRPGRTERQVAAVAEGRMRELGAEGFGIETMVGSGPRHSGTILARASQRPISRGDVVSVTLVPRCEGYHACLARAFTVGPNAEAQRWIDLAWDVQRAGAQELAAGREGRQVAARCREIVAAAGCGARIDEVWVHSTGIVEFEPPSFAPDSPATIGADAAVNIDVPLFDAPWGGLRVENGFALEGGALRPRIADAEGLVPIVL